MDPRSPVRPGQPLALAAEQVNWINRQMRGDCGFRSGAAASFMQPYTWVYGLNTTATTADRFSVLKIEGVSVVPTSTDSDAATAQFASMPVLELSQAVDGDPSACVALEPIADDAVGRVAVAGVVQVRADQLDKLGGSEVLWKNDDWALVRLSGGEQVRLGRISGTWAKDQSAEVEKLDADGSVAEPASEFTAYNYFERVYVPSGSYRRVACGLVGDRWILIEAEDLRSVGDGDDGPCETRAAATSLDEDADKTSDPSGVAEGDGMQVLVNDGGCAKWLRVSLKTVVTDVSFGEGDLVKTTKDIYVFDSTASGGTNTVFSTTECPPPE